MSIYIFGKLGDSYTQFPEDYTHELFSSYETKIMSNAQIMIRREGEIIYYSFLRRISGSGKYIGISFVFNGVMHTDVLSLYKLCETSITNWVVNGDLLEFADNGDIIARTDKLYKVKGDFQRLTDNLYAQFKDSDDLFSKLPPVNLAVNITEVKQFSVKSTNDTTDDDKNRKICEALKDFQNIYIYFNQTDSALSGYAEKLKRLSSLNEALTQENAKVKKQKKQYGFVAVLLIFIIIASGAFIYINDQKNLQISGLQDDVISTQRTITSQKSNISDLENKIEDYKKTIADRTLTISQLNAKVKSLEEQNERLQDDSDRLVQENANLQAIKYNLENDLNRTRREFEQYKTRTTQNASVKAEPPFVISSVEIANVDKNNRIETNYGYPIKSRSSMYLRPRITLKGNSLGNHTIFIKWFTPDGRLSTNNYSPSGYSQVTTINVTQKQASSSFELPGWGGNDKGHWAKGTYRIEVWYDGACIYTKMFAIN